MSERGYREFESGRLLHPKPRLVEHLGQVLGMTRAERDLLYRLAMRRPASSTAFPAGDIRGLRSMLDGMAEPALLTDVAWNALAWNRALVEHVQDPTAVPEQARNSILWMFSGAAPERIPGVHGEYERLVGRVRMAYLADYGRTSVLRELVAQLRAIPQAAERWNAGALALDPVSTPRMLASPATGTGRVNTFSTRLPGQGLRLIVSVPEPAAP